MSLHLKLINYVSIIKQFYHENGKYRANHLSGCNIAIFWYYCTEVEEKMMQALESQ